MVRTAVGSGQSVGGSRSDATRTCPDAECRLPSANAVLDRVCDPELPFLTIRELGILRDVGIDGDTLKIVITPTYSGCPANDFITLEITTALTRAGLEPFRIELARAPAWTTDWITPEGRAKLLDNGIAPPAKAAGKRALFSAEPVVCPRCGSAETEQISAFGSTACKAHHRCQDCREPFEAFKCL